MSRKINTDIKSCYHCGEEIPKGVKIQAEEKGFCCQGCLNVYDLLQRKNLCAYYEIDEQPGINSNFKIRDGKFDFLLQNNIAEKLIHFKTSNQHHVKLYLPQMHCASCVWLLERISEFDEGVLSSRVNFLKKEITVIFNPDKTNLKNIAEALSRIGYEPHLSLKDTLKGEKVKPNTAKLYKIGIAGFCFGNIMMLSFPEYFAGDLSLDENLKRYFSYLNILLSLPVFFYAASEFFISAWQGFRKKFLNIDAPIALAILVTFARSIYDVFSKSGPGYFDSMSGIVFFMLVGRFLQDKTHNALSFNRDFTSYFPIAVTKILNGIRSEVMVAELKSGDRIVVHHDEIVPADAILLMGKAELDYSFVSGESNKVHAELGEIVYAGARQTGAALELELIKPVSQSYLTSLWNNKVFNKEKTKSEESFIHRLSRQFTYILFSIALIAFVYWMFVNSSNALHALTSVLIVACPCALLLTATFTNGSLLQILQERGIFLKNEIILERLNSIKHIVFDKTGTLTKRAGMGQAEFKGSNLTEEEKVAIKNVCAQSNHPASRAISLTLNAYKKLSVKEFKEFTGKGIEGFVNGLHIRLGSEEFIFGQRSNKSDQAYCVYVEIDGSFSGYYVLHNEYRNGVKEMFNELNDRFSLSVISGDNDSEKKVLESMISKNHNLLFRQSPEEKLNYVKHLQSKNQKVLMIGDGLNDSGALAQSYVGIAITESINNFSPAADIIMDASNLSRLPKIIDFIKFGNRIIWITFIVSVIYNIVGLYFAVTAQLQPVIAAILMPASSLSIILLTTGLSRFAAMRILKKLK